MSHALQARFYRYDKRLERELKSRIVDHLLRLTPEDRHMRFFAALNETAIRNYTEKLGEKDELFFTFKPDAELGYRVTGFLHVAKMSDDACEIGVSVDSNARGQGIATKLFDRAFLYVRATGYKKIYINCLSTNTAMQKIVAKYKLETFKDPDDPYTKTAIVEMKDGPSVFAYLQGLADDQIALFDLALSSTRL